MSEAVTRQISVRVRSSYLPEQSSPEENRYLFSYHVEITNDGAETVQLLSREWIITDANGQEETVIGDGVVGEQPVLLPTQSFQYTSFCPLVTSVGSMHGWYRMVTDSGERFNVRIAPFTLAVPTAVN